MSKWSDYRASTQLRCHEDAMQALHLLALLLAIAAASYTFAHQGTVSGPIKSSTTLAPHLGHVHWWALSCKWLR